MVIVMTDGRQTRDPDAVDLNVAADPIHRQGARVLVVGIGPEISQYELRLIAKDSSYVFTVQSFESLTKATRDVAASACINPGKFMIAALLLLLLLLLLLTLLFFTLLVHLLPLLLMLLFFSIVAVVVAVTLNPVVVVFVVVIFPSRSKY